MANHREWPCCHIFLFTLHNSRDKTASLLWTPFPLTDTFSLSEWNTSFSRRAASCTMFSQGYCSYFPHFTCCLATPPSSSSARHLWGPEGCPTCHTGAALALGPPTHPIFYAVGKSQPAPAWACWLAPRKDLYLQPSREGQTRSSWHRHSTCCSQLPGPHEPQVVGPKVVIVFHRVSV